MIGIVCGTRPELIKLAPVIHELGHRKLPFVFIHTGQHYSPELDGTFIGELGLPPPTVRLNVGSQPPAHQLAGIIQGVAGALVEHAPRVVLVQGDTNSVLGGALAALKLGIPVAHLEAGLRSDDWDMPEEANRVLTGHLADVHFCPTPKQAERLAGEGLRAGVYVVGNSVVDATLRYSSGPGGRSAHPSRPDGRYMLLTLHRPSNVDTRERLGRLLSSLGAVARALGLRVVFPAHPRTKARMEAFGLLSQLGSEFHVVPPVGYLENLSLQRGAQVVVTDSGGIQEEACILRVPCVTLRENTERPETVDVGANRLCGSAEVVVLQRAIEAAMHAPRDWQNPFGDGTTSVKVVDVLASMIKTQKVA